MTQLQRAFAVVRLLRGYHRGDDRLGAELVLSGIDLVKLHEIFHIKDESDPMYDSYPVDKRQANLLTPYLKHPLDLTRFDYFLEADDASSRRKSSAVGRRHL